MKARDANCRDFSGETNTICEHHSDCVPRGLSMLICSLNTMYKHFSENVFHNLGLMLLGPSLHRHWIERSSRICNKTKEIGKNERNQRTGISHE